MRVRPGLERHSPDEACIAAALKVRAVVKDIFKVSDGEQPGGVVTMSRCCCLPVPLLSRKVRIL
jgi:hypothetical protein